MGNQKTSSIIETEEGELVGNKSLALVAMKGIPDLIEDIIDEMDPKAEREVIQRFICEPPLYDDQPNSIRYISRVMHVSKHFVGKTIVKFKQIVWRNMNGKDTRNN